MTGLFVHGERWLILAAAFILKPKKYGQLETGPKVLYEPNPLIKEDSLFLNLMIFNNLYLIQT